MSLPSLPPFHALMERAFSEVAELTFRPLVASLPETVFHYTTAAGLAGIAQSGELWATHVGHLNDATEFVYAEARLRACLESASPATGMEERFLTKLAWKASGDFTMTNLIDVYVTCFCEDQDLLSMWRSYASAGYNIGFDPRELRESAAKDFDGRTSWFARVIYDPTQQHALLSNLVDAALRVAGAVPGHIARQGLQYTDDEALEILVGNFARFVVPFLCFIKHPGFREERELRAVQTGWTFIDYPSGIKLRADNRGLVPYLTLGPASGGRFDLKSVTVGPCASPEASKQAAQRLLTSEGYAACVTTVSSIPIRTRQ